MKKSPRGFSIFGDYQHDYGGRVRIHRSSNVRPACWLTIDNKKAPGFDSPECANSAHLTPGQAKRIIQALERFLKEVR